MEDTKMAKRSSGAVKVAKTKRPVRSGPAVRVEYPREGEMLAQPHYTFHIGAIPEANVVELSIDQGDWAPCRESLGLWWYDWTDAPKGEHVVVARSRVSDDLWIVSEPRRFSVG
jgi:hypothetical protein